MKLFLFARVLCRSLLLKINDQAVQLLTNSHGVVSRNTKQYVGERRVEKPPRYDDVPYHKPSPLTDYGWQTR